jgi:hypothetical protein
MGDSINSLREKLIDKTLTPEERRKLREELVKKIREKGIVKLKSGEPAEYHITYDTFGGTLEPVYFWTLDFLRNSSPSGLGLEVNKIEEQFEASAGGGFFGEMGTKAGIMQDRAMKTLEVINTVLRTLINLIYDLKEYDMRLEVYDNLDPKKQSKADERQSAIYALKAIWMDQVDMKAGMGSINNLTRGDLGFVTLRDAFMQANNAKQANKLDLNKRVKVILLKKLKEYNIWKNASEIELRKRYSIERNYLKAQVDSLRLYTKWAKPYLRAAQKLGMKEFTTKAGLPSPDMVAAFNNMQMELKLFAKREIKPTTAYESYKKLKFEDKYYSCVEVEFKLRTAPQIAKQGQATHYAHLGVIDVIFKPYSLTGKDISDIEKLEVFEDMDIVEHLTESSLKDLQADIDHYLKGEKDEEGLKIKKKSSMPNPLKGFGELLSPLGSLVSAKKATTYQKGLVIGAVKSDAMSSCQTLYSVFKKSHRMISW